MASAMEDLSGGVTESYYGRQISFKVLLRSYQKGAMIAAAIFSKGSSPPVKEQEHSFKSNR